MNTKVVTGIVVSTVLVLLFAVFVISSPSNNPPRINASGNANAYTLDPTSYDWGDISYDGETATKSFKIKNKGTDTLKLYNVKTSCHCTKAQLITGDQQSPLFGMSDVSSWISEVKPGEEATLVVRFDQRYHGPQGLGPVTRFVSVDTNDRSNSKLTFTLTGTVIKK